MPTRQNVLIVDDSLAVRSYVATLLKATGLRVLEADSGMTALSLVNTERVDLVLLDMAMPGLSGVETLKQLRQQWIGPVIMVSGHEEPERKVEALDSGADDYVTKPFLDMELLARIRANLRRPKPAGAPMTVASLSINPVSGVVVRNGKRLRLSKMETALLLLLAAQQGRVIKSAEITQEMWSRDDEHTRHALRVLIRKLRVKIEDDPDHPQVVLTEAQLGYRLQT